MGRLENRVAVVTGGGRGIGRAIALELAREGANIVISSRTRSQLEADALNRLESKTPISEAVRHFGQIDILVNNVGGHVPGDQNPYTHDDDTFEANLALNLTSTYWTTREALPHMKKQGFGRILTIGSGYAKRSGGKLAYTTAKHGLIGFTKALAGQVAADGITVNCLCPGWTNTALVDWEAMGRARGTDAAEARVWRSSENLQNRILEPEELGPMAALLAAPESAGITGQVISVDGGFKV
jgi:meso-butanediol dehydrogenase/(S,S)-butanediol dehydrogenase/diacetyl reductase